MIARQGFEPRFPGSEPGVLPLDDLASSGGPWSRTKPSRVSDERAEDHGHLSPWVPAPEVGIEPTCSRATTVRLSTRPLRKVMRRRMARGSNPRTGSRPAHAVAGRCIPTLPPIPFPASGSGATRTPRRWPSYLFSRQAPDPAGSLPRRADLLSGVRGQRSPNLPVKSRALCQLSYDPRRPRHDSNVRLLR